MMRVHKPLLAVALFLLALPALAQDPRGKIMGRVTDASGAVMPGVEIRVTNPETGTSVAAATNASGNFNLPYLLATFYTVTAEMQGFKKYVRERIQVRVSETVELNIQMEVGGRNETMTVTAETPLLDTSGSSLGQVIDERRVLELPIFSGNPSELTLLAPGVSNATDLRIRKAGFNNAPSQISSDGSGQYNSEFQIDGVTNNFANGNGTSRVAFSPPPTAIKEFKIQTNAYDASIGHTIGAVTNVSTASGTNDIHGEAHYWARNSALDAPTFFQNKNKTKAAVYQDHRYGASAGGPVYIPGLYNGKNKTFWYYAWEANKWGSPQSGSLTVPTVAERSGDFSALLKLGSNYQIYDPLTTRSEAGGRFRRDPFQGNIIPSSRLDPVSQKLLSFYPLPNQVGTSTGLNNYFYSLSAKEDYYVHLVRIDHAFSENHRIFARLHYDWWEEDKDHWFGDYSAIILNRINRGFALDDVYVINPSMVLNVRYGITSQDFPERRVTQGYDLSSLGFSQSLLGLIDKNLATIPYASASSFDALGRWESGDGADTSLTHSVSANLTRLQGNHNLKFGADIRVYRGNHNRFPYSTAPYFSFANTYTRGPLDSDPAAPIGQEMAAFVLGVPGGSMQYSASWAMQEQYYGIYLQDDWKVNSKLTLNLGLRYELETPLTERFNRLVAGFAYGQSNPIEAQAQANYAKNPIPEIPPGQFKVQGGLTFVDTGGIGRSPYKGEKNNFQPRFGFAYQVFRDTILRGGYAIFHDTLGVNSNVGIQTGFSQSTPIQASLDSGLTYYASMANPLPAGLIPVQGASGGLATNLGQAISFYDYNIKQPYAQRWSFGIQQLLPWQFMLESTYVGNRGTRLGVTRQLNNTPAEYLSTSPTRDQATINYLSQSFKSPFYGIDPVYGANMSRANLLKPYPQFGNVSVEEPIGYSVYHAMQNRIERRFRQGFTFQLAYTWSKLMSASSFLNDTDPLPYYVIDSFDRTHRIATSGIWEIPIGHGRRYGASLPSVVNGVIGGWQISGIYTQQSGPPLGFGNIIFTGNLEDIALPKEERDVDRWFNTDAGFNKSSAQQLSSNIRTFPLRLSGVRGDNQVRWDFSFRKDFPMHEDVRMEFRAETYNAFNQTSFNTPNTTPTSSSFGRCTSVVSPSGRSWQFALKLVF
jgi:hypothetical protein